MICSIYIRELTEQTGVSNESRKSVRQRRSSAPLPPLPRRQVGASLGNVTLSQLNPMIILESEGIRYKVPAVLSQAEGRRGPACQQGPYS